MKVILVIDKPENCDNCQLMNSYFDNGYGWIKECLGSGENDCIVFNKKIEDYCPLRPLPQYINSKDEYNLKFGNSSVNGWNACIDEILGEE